MTSRRQRALVLAAGAFSLAVQTTLLRELLVAFQGHALGTGAFFASWLLWVAAGAWIGSRLEPGSRWLTPGVLAYLPAALLQLLAWTFARELVGAGPGELVSLERLLLLSLVLNAPTSLITGWLFPALATQGSGSETSDLYAWESLGCFLGGAALSVGLVAGAPPLTVLGLAGLGLVAASWQRRHLALGAAAGLLSLTAVAGGPWLTHRLARAQALTLVPDAQVLLVEDTPQSRWAALERQGQISVLRDGQVLSTHPDPADAPAAVAMAVAQARDPGRVLVLGDGQEEVVRELLLYPGVEQVDWVVGDARAFEDLGPWLPASARAAREDPRVRVHHADARVWLTQTEEQWDLVWLGSSDPGTLAEARLHTVEMMRAVHRVLTRQGLLATRVMAGETYQGEALLGYARSVLAAQAGVFPEIALVPGDPLEIYAGRSESAPSEELGGLVRRHRALGYQGRYPSEALAEREDPRRLAKLRADLGELGLDQASTDEHPRALGLYLEVLAQLGGAGAGLLRGARSLGHALWLVPLLVFGALRAWLSWTRPQEEADGSRLSVLVAAATGFSGLSLGVLLLYAFQLRAGVLFGKVGLATALLLVGTALGAGLGGWLLRRLDPEPVRAAGRLPRLPRLPLLAAAALAGLGLLLPVILDLLPQGPDAARPMHGLLLLSGVIAGMGFPAAVALRSPGEPSAGPLFAADHLGAAAGAAVVGLVVAPLLSVSGAGLLLACLQVVLVGLVLLRWAGATRVSAARTRSTWGRLPHLLTGVALTALLLGGLTRHRLDAPSLELSPRQLVPLDTVLSWQAHDQPFLHHTGHDTEGHLVQAAAISRAAKGETRGYAGPVSAVVAVDAQGTYTHLALHQHRETPSYARPVGPWLEHLVGRSASERLTLTQDGGQVDAITGSTLTCRAALAAVDGAGAALTAEVLELPVQPAQRTPWRPGWAAPLLLLALALGAVSALRGRPWLRWTVLGLGTAGLGLWLNTLPSLEALAPVLSGTWPGLANPALLAMVLGLTVLTVALGPVWCGQICPFGALQELLGRLGLTLGVSPALDRRLRGLKYLLLFLAVVGFALSGDHAWLTWDPLAHAFSRWPSGWSLAVVGGALAGSAFLFRGWCRYLCPVGALLSLANGLPWTRRWLPRRVSRCDLGVRGGDLDCIQCGRCVREALPSRGAVEPARRPRADVVVVVGVVVLVVLAAGAGLSERSLDVPGGARDVDEEMIELMIQEGKLSDHEAEFWE